MLTTYKPSKNNRQLFNDGILTGIRIDGPKITENLTRPIPYGNKVIGESRFYHAMGEKVQLSKVVVIPWEQGMMDIGKVELQDFKDGAHGIFKVVQFQEVPDSAPPAMQLSLEKLTTHYEDLRK
ncbi:hypothetical protein [Faecalibaculum rodentium]|uniref:hypothetical protein n=1 Tax=Faecalibaculum rodentium TaxID=1702221 RepID=UPI00272CB5BF|nr:hypothetical protein [Faecalibaculum rodentium]